MEIIITELPNPNEDRKDHVNHKEQFQRGSKRKHLQDLVKVIFYPFLLLITRLRLIWRKRPILAELLGVALLILTMILSLVIGNYFSVTKIAMENDLLKEQIQITQQEIREQEQLLQSLYQWHDLHDLQSKSRLRSLLTSFTQLGSLFPEQFYFTALSRENRQSPLILTGRVASFDLMQEIVSLFKEAQWEVITEVQADGAPLLLFTLLLQPQSKRLDVEGR